MAAIQRATVTAIPWPPASAALIIASISGMASAWLPRRQASWRAAFGWTRDPVASRTALASVVWEAAAPKSPLQAAIMPAASR